MIYFQSLELSIATMTFMAAMHRRFKLPYLEDLAVATDGTVAQADCVVLTKL